jgi:hypothetical protein
MFSALCMKLCKQTTIFTVSITPAGRHACIDKSMQIGTAFVNTTFLADKEALIIKLWLVLRKLAADMSCMILGTYVEALSAHTGTYLTSSNYNPRIVCASLCFQKR